METRKSRIILSAIGCAAQWGRKLLTGDLQILRQYAGLAHRGDEAGVPHPPRQSVHMDVSGDPGPSSLADIKAEIQPIRTIHLSQSRLAALRQTHQLFERGNLGFL